MKSYDVRYMVQQYLNRNGKREARFRENLPGLDWFKTFMLRHPNLTIKSAEHTKIVRAAVSYEIIESYFSELKDTLKDVSGFCESCSEALGKHAHRIIDTSKSSTSVMFAISGDGKLLPPYDVYEAKHLYPGWTEGGFPGSRYNRTPSGWFDSCTFEDWFSTIVLPSMRNLDGPKIEKVGVKTTADVGAGFKACGIIPFNPDAVLGKIVRIRPQEEQQDVETAMETTWTDTIETHLNLMRSGGAQAPKRGEKVDASAGKSIGAADPLI
ncbi:hypothetical protein JTB14_024281 [Gonioctena quinquepunctata]|nr:hypothetical protein JTB14_024281 [Gonioctena quinquepunctata]